MLPRQRVCPAPAGEAAIIARAALGETARVLADVSGGGCGGDPLGQPAGGLVPAGVPGDGGRGAAKGHEGQGAKVQAHGKAPRPYRGAEHACRRRARHEAASALQSRGRAAI
jgi:hypothetical protein